MIYLISQPSDLLLLYVHYVGYFSKQYSLHFLHILWDLFWVLLENVALVVSREKPCSQYIKVESHSLAFVEVYPIR